MELLFETHRDRMTTDLLFTLQLIDAVPAMKLTADLSHYLVGREFRYPVDEENHALIGRILDRSWAFHGRVASREQVQVQIGFPQNRIWLDLFLGWWEQGFRAWRAQAPPAASLVFTPELGPPEWYAMTGPDGLEMSDRWEEAVQLKGLDRGSVGASGERRLDGIQAGTPDAVHAAAREHYLWSLVSREEQDEGIPLVLTEGEGVHVRSIDGDALPRPDEHELARGEPRLRQRARWRAPSTSNSAGSTTPAAAHSRPT